MATDAVVTEGLAYVGAERPEPGEVVHKVDFFRVVMGPRPGEPMPDAFSHIADDLRASGLSVEISDNMMRSALSKLIRVATLSATMLYVGGTAGDIAADSDAMDLLGELCEEIALIGDALGAPLDGDPIADVLAMVGTIPPSYRTSLKEDYDKGQPTEVKAQILDVLALGTSAGVEMPAYRRIVDSLALAD